MISLRAFLTLNAVLFVPFGIGMATIPATLFPMFGIDLDADGLLMGRIVGSALLSIGLISYLARDEPFSTIGMRAILAGSLVFHTIDATTTLIATSCGVMNALGWMFSSMHFALAIGFLLYLRTPKRRLHSSSKNQIKI